MENPKKNSGKIQRKYSTILLFKKTDIFKINELRDFQILIFKISGITFLLVSAIYFISKFN